ncbi:MAG: translation initiation factor IF-3 [Elusimicrobia bacterium]|nr:translation initiation factor IF-3 [Elusimicrobiota bacterium]
MQKRILVNERIRDEKVLLIDENGKNQGIVERFKALNMAKVKGLDLVAVGTKDNITVCKIMDFAKYKYQMAKKHRGAKHISGLKEVRFRPHTDDHDLEVKIGKIKRFIKEGFKVRVTIFFRGRENIFKNEGYKQMDRIAQAAGDIARMENRPQFFGKRLIALFVKKK